MIDKILLCEDSIEGIFSAVYNAYELKLNHEQTEIYTFNQHNYVLFAEYINVSSNEGKTKKVARTIIKDFGFDCYSSICHAISSCDEDKANSIYHMIVEGYRMKNKKNLITSLANEYVNKVFELNRYVNYEIHHLLGFLRFTELENGMLFSKIGPKNNIITFLAPHFADRFPNENFVIYDEIRQLFVVHPSHMKWTVVTGEYLNEEIISQVSKEEEKYRELFTFFCQKITIKERINIGLQTQMLPLRFREYMTEFQVV